MVTRSEQKKGVKPNVLSSMDTVPPAVSLDRWGMDLESNDGGREEVNTAVEGCLDMSLNVRWTGGELCECFRSMGEVLRVAHVLRSMPKTQDKRPSDPLPVCKDLTSV